MPYIDKERRDELDCGLKILKENMGVLHSESIIVAGDLNYIAFSLAKEYIKLKGTGYNNISDAIKALTGAAHEIERRILDAYEEKMIAANGDVE